MKEIEHNFRRFLSYPSTVQSSPVKLKISVVMVYKLEHSVKDVPVSFYRGSLYHLKSFASVHSHWNVAKLECMSVGK